MHSHCEERSTEFTYIHRHCEESSDEVIPWASTKPAKYYLRSSVSVSLHVLRFSVVKKNKHMSSTEEFCLRTPDFGLQPSFPVSFFISCLVK